MSGRYLKPPWMQRKVGNRIAPLFRPSLISKLSVPGRRTGRWQTVPVAVLEHGGERYLVSYRGESDWARNLRAAGGGRLTSRGDSEVISVIEVPAGERPARAYIMGRKMFGGGEGAWDHAWTGSWGEDPPYHAPVFVLTHHRREPVVMQGGTTFTFVTDGPESALARARAAAGEKDVAIAGGASTVQQYLSAGMLD